MLRGSCHPSDVAIWLCVMWLAAAFPTAQAVQHIPPASAPANSPPSLLSREALDDYLTVNAGKPTPLDKLPALARQRFLGSLVFTPKGLASFNMAELSTELTQQEIIDLLQLFDADAYARMATPRHSIPSPQWRDGAHSPGIIELGFDALYHTHRHGDTHQLVPQFNELIARWLDRHGEMSTLPDRELVYLLRAIELVSTESVQSKDIERLQSAIAELHSRQAALPQDHRLLYGLLLRNRQFDAARKHAALYPAANLPKLPALIDPFKENAPAFTVWRASADANTLTRTALDLTRTQILVTAGCHFSQDAAEDIAKDPLLGPIFAAHSQWLMLSPGMEDPQAIREWNARFPDAPAQQIYERNEWKLLPPGWKMPQFLIVRNGQIIEQVAGWQRGVDAHRQQLIEAIRRAGLSGPPGKKAQGNAAYKR